MKFIRALSEAGGDSYDGYMPSKIAMNIDVLRKQWDEGSIPTDICMVGALNRC